MDKGERARELLADANIARPIDRNIGESIRRGDNPPWVSIDSALAAIEAALEPLAEPGREADDTERDIRIAIWNAGMNGGMGQDLTQAFIQRAMEEPTMKRALAALREPSNV